MKKIICLLMSFIVLLILNGCNVKQVESEKDNSDIKNNTDIAYETLSIEYDVEDYAENAIIVSKNDGLVYGLLDNKGKEIIPVKYDDMSFMNKDDYIDGHFELYISCSYENMNYIFDVNGKKLLETEDEVGYADSIFKNAKAPVFEIGNLRESYELYNKDMVKIGVCPDDVEDIISSRCCLVTRFVSVNKLTHSYIYDFNGNILEDFGELMYITKTNVDNKCILFFIEETSYSESTSGKAYHIGESGNILAIKDMTYGEFLNKYNIKPYNLYKTNSTYKMEDLNGNTLYKERYYKEYNVSGKNDCVFLTDENDSICVFGRQGKLYVEFGNIVIKNDDLYLMTKNGNSKINEIHEGKESVAVVISKSEGSEIYFYNK